MRGQDLVSEVEMTIWAGAFAAVLVVLAVVWMTSAGWALWVSYLAVAGGCSLVGLGSLVWVRCLW